MQSVRPSFDPVSSILGSWAMRATSLPMWLSGLTNPPRYVFSASTESPDKVAESLSYVTLDGQEVVLESANRVSGATFISRGNGMALFATRKWSVSGVSSDGVVVAVRFEKTRSSAEGVNIMVRDGVERPNLRSEVASDIDSFGLEIEEFASITWFGTTQSVRVAT